jgi:hypothetical protein
MGTRRKGRSGSISVTILFILLILFRFSPMAGYPVVPSVIARHPDPSRMGRMSRRMVDNNTRDGAAPVEEDEEAPCAGPVVPVEKVDAVKAARPILHYWREDKKPRIAKTLSDRRTISKICFYRFCIS